MTPTKLAEAVEYISKDKKFVTNLYTGKKSAYDALDLVLAAAQEAQDCKEEQHLKVIQDLMDGCEGLKETIQAMERAIDRRDRDNAAEGAELRGRIMELENENEGLLSAWKEDEDRK